MEGDTESCLADHRQIVGAIAHSNGLGEVYLLYLCYQFQQFSLAMTIYNLAHIATRQFAILTDFQFVGIHIVDAVATLQLLVEIGKSTTEDGNLIATGL